MNTHRTRLAAALALVSTAGCMSAHRGAYTTSASAGYAHASPPMAAAATSTPAQPQAQVAASEAQPEPEHGTLTAASVGDVDRRDNYLAYLGRHAEIGASMRLDMTRRMRVRVLDANERPVANAAVTVASGEQRAVGRTHADGRWDYHPGVNARSITGEARVQVSVDNGQAVEQSVSLPERGDAPELVVHLPGATAAAPRVLDLGFAIDVTGSMGDELRYVNHEIAGIVRRIQAAAPGVQVRVGATFYRDRGDSELVRTLPFTTDVQRFAAEMRDVDADGGGDYPEDMNTGLQTALHQLSWTPGPHAARVLVLVADAPPQMYSDQNYTWRDALFDASRTGVRILPVAASGADRSVEYLFRAMGSATSTPYVYLTDDSGVGGHHMEADTDRVAVERFARLIERLVIADLQGEGMHEPGPFGAQDDRAVAATGSRVGH